MTKLNTYFSMSIVNIIFSRQGPVLPDFQPKFGAFVCIFIEFFCSSKIWCFCSYFHLVPLGQFQFTFVFKIPFRHFVCFGKIINCIAVQLMMVINNCTPLNQSASSNFVMLIIKFVINKVSANGFFWKRRNTLVFFVFFDQICPTLLICISNNAFLVCFEYKCL